MTCVALPIDDSQPVRRPGDLLALVEAIRAAAANDETDWIEWKSQWNLASREGQFHLSRHILGMANRPPATAALHAGGCGYVVFGVQPGEINGVTEIDPADLDAGTRPYMPLSNPPTWSASYVHPDGKPVLVVLVEPPRQGDPIHALHRAFGKYQAGAIFVRRPGRTIMAEPADIIALSDRLSGAATPLTLRLSPVEGDVVTIRPLDADDALLRPLLSFERERLLTPPPRAGGNEPGLLGRQHDISRLVAGMGVNDPRYRERVDTYIEELRNYHVSRAVVRYVEQEFAALKLRVVNGSERNYAAVRVKVVIPGPIQAFDPAEETPKPTEPRAPAPGELINLEALARSYSRVGVPGAQRPKAFTIVNEEESAVIHFDVGHIRPLDDVPLPALLLTVNEPGGRVVTADWEVTTSTVDAVERGTVQLEVVDPVALATLLPELSGNGV